MNLFTKIKNYLFPMSPETRSAILRSIEAWEHKATTDDFSEISLGPQACPLCKLFYNKDCRGCPVGSYQCRGTPYGEALNALVRVHLDHPLSEAIDRWRAAARKEVEFLKGLLP